MRPHPLLAHSLRGLPYAAIDTETTDVPPDGRAIEVAIVHGRLGVEAPEVVGFARVRPGRPSHPAALRVHGISDAEAECGLDPRAVDRDLGELLHGRAIVMWASHFDLFMIGRIFGWTKSPVIDAKVWAWNWSGARSLAQAVEQLGVTPSRAHRSAGDALMTARVVEGLWGHMVGNPAFRWPTLGDLVSEQREVGAQMERALWPDKPERWTWRPAVAAATEAA